MLMELNLIDGVIIFTFDGLLPPLSERAAENIYLRRVRNPEKSTGNNCS